MNFNNLNVAFFIRAQVQTSAQSSVFSAKGSCNEIVGS